ncbi:unnamed protein product [Acanthoscelides obtectus]|uniref:Uncharacterized protein n=1 Tax=Acanthoscelides obtectus TaxID=200917 RepID=A0A9P0LC92_ACAOB|nr:unnamed protein product [Acanthoscelides obtectus]CAK1684272.1 hypothetical protein AOBTE_LOCUS34764 [Acanthoscelides obtectus]
MKRPWSILSTISLSSLTMEHSEYTNGIEHSLCYKIVFNNSKRLVDRGVQMILICYLSGRSPATFYGQASRRGLKKLKSPKCSTQAKKYSLPIFHHYLIVIASLMVENELSFQTWLVSLNMLKTCCR